MTMHTAANPFYATRLSRQTPCRYGEPYRPVYVRLPLAPRTASPVPELTSLYHFDDDGRNRDPRYPGNCGGNLIRDLLRFFKPGTMYDPMTGSGTCRDVCKELGIYCWSNDLHQGFDACGPSPFNEAFAFCWLHPPYWRMKTYNDDPRCLSRAPTLDAFLERYALLLKNCTQALLPGGKLAVLMGDYCDREEGFVSLTYHTKRLAFAAGLQQHCVDIIRFSHGTGSSRKVYRSSFIPGLNDVCVIFEKQS